LFAAFSGARLRAVRERQHSLWIAWSTANFSRAKKLPALMPMLQKLDSSTDGRPREMTKREIRTTIMGIAQAFGAKVTYKKRSEL
jgi:hypothetical protein